MRGVGVSGAVSGIMPGLGGACLGCLGAGPAATVGASTSIGGVLLGLAVLFIAVGWQLVRAERACRTGPMPWCSLSTSLAVMGIAAVLGYAGGRAILLPLITAWAAPS